MKQKLAKLFMIVFTISLSMTVNAQSITNVVAPSAPNDCTPTVINTAVTQLCINYIYNGTSHVVNGNTITLTIAWTTPGPICQGALAFLTPAHNMGQLPANNYTLNVVTTLDGVVQQSSSQQMNVTSCCPANASIIGSAANVCVGDTVLLVSTSSNATSSFWSQNGTNLSSNDSLSLNFNTPGQYPITLNATDGSCVDSTTYIITVSNYPVVDLGPDTITCSGQSLLINGANSIPGVSYSWSNNTTSPLLNVSSAGTYSLTVTNNGCSSTDTVMVTAQPSPVFSLGADTTACQGDMITLDATATGNSLSYNWSNNASTPTTTVNTGGTYTVTVTNDVNCTVIDNIVINFETVPNPSLGNDTTICAGSPLVLDGFSNGATLFSWNTGATSPTLSVDTSGTYTITSYSPSGCTGTDDIMVTVDALPSPNLIGDTTLCAGATLVLDGTTSDAVSYSWSGGATSPSITVDSANNYTVTATSANGCSGSASVNVTYSSIAVDLGADTIDITTSQSVTLDAGVTGVSYLWSTNETTQTISVNVTGTYSVTVTDANGCSADDFVLITNTTNTENQLIERVRVFPNPANDYLVIDANGLSLSSATIINGIGQIINEVSIQGNNTISLSHLSVGIYYLQLRNNDGEMIGTTKFIKQ